jgi:O-antigen ligase
MPINTKIIKWLDISIEWCLLALIVGLSFSHTAALQAFAYVGGFIFWVLKSILIKKFEFDKTSIWLPLLLFGIAIFISGITSVDPQYSLGQVRGEFITYVLIYYLVVHNIRTIYQVKRLLSLLIIASAIVGGYGILQYFRHHIRISSFLSDYNYLSTYLVIVIPIVASILFSSNFKRKFLKPILLIVLLVLFIALMFTLSRGAWVGFLCEALILTLFTKDKRLMSFFFLLCMIGVFFLPDNILYRAKTIIDISKYKTEETIGPRFEVWKFGLSRIREEPFFGIGYGRDIIPRKYPEEKMSIMGHEHNLFLETALEIGIPGLAAFIWLIGSLLKFLRKAFLSIEDDFKKAVILGVGAMVVGFFVRCIFDCVYVDNLARLLWMLIGVGVATSKIK